MALDQMKGELVPLDAQDTTEYQAESLSNSSQPIYVPCPICQQELPNLDDTVNKHVDECLNRREIAQIASSSSSTSNPRRKRSRPIDQYFDKPSG